MKRLAIITSHIIQYQLPFFKEISRQKNITPFFFAGSNHGLKKNSYDKNFQNITQWKRKIEIKNFYISKKNNDINSFFIYYSNLYKILKQKKIDSILILGWNKLIFWQAIFFALITKTKISLRVENNLEHKQNIIKKGIKYIIFPIFFKIFYKFFYIGTLNKRFYLNYKVKKKKLFFSPYSVDNFFFQKEKKINSLKKKTINFIFVGKFIERKNVKIILEVAKELNEYRDIKFNLVGNGPLYQRYLDYKKKNKLKQVNFIGFQNQSQLINNYYKNDILILPSKYETWGLVVNEAMAAGLFCLVSNQVGSRYDLIIKKKTGLIFKYNSLKDLKDKILYLKKNYSKLKKFRKKIFITINKYSIKNSVKNLINEI